MGVNLCSDVLPQILSYLPHQDLFRCLRVNRHFYNTIKKNWSKMKRPTAFVQVQAHIRGFAIVFYFHRNQNCQKGPQKLMITDANIGFSFLLENLVLQMLRERGEVSNSELVLALPINSKTDGLRELLSFLFKRLRVTEFILCPKKSFVDPPIGGPRYKYDHHDFSAEHLECIYKLMKKAKITAVKTEFVNVCPSLLDIHTLVDQITLAVRHFDYNTLKSLETRKTINIESEYIKFAPLGELLNEWFDGKRQIKGITAVSLLGGHEDLPRMRGVDGFDAMEEWLLKLPSNCYSIVKEGVALTNKFGQKLSVTLRLPTSVLYGGSININPSN